MEREGKPRRQEYELQKRNVKIVFLYHDDDIVYTLQYYQSYLNINIETYTQKVLNSYTLTGTLTTDSASCKLFLALFCNILSHKYLHKVSL